MADVRAPGTCTYVEEPTLHPKRIVTSPRMPVVVAPCEISSHGLTKTFLVSRSTLRFLTSPAHIVPPSVPRADLAVDQAAILHAPAVVDNGVGADEEANDRRDRKSTPSELQSQSNILFPLLLPN